MSMIAVICLVPMVSMALLGFIEIRSNMTNNSNL